MSTQKENWVNFSEVKKAVSMEMVLARYGLLEKLKRSGADLVGVCPIHKGSNPRQFSVSLTKNAYHCFGNCKGGGNVLDFVAKMECISIREAGLLLQEWFPDSIAAPTSSGTSAVRAKEAKPKQDRKKTVKKALQNDQAEKKEEPADAIKAVNPPLTFTLKNLVPEHPFFSERNINAETVRYFGLGYCSRGMMSGRIAIPVHNESGELVAYCGRAVSPEQITDTGKYKLPPGFEKARVVYNLNRQPKTQTLLIVVESYLSVWKLHQAGIENAVALMGSQLSEYQENLIVSLLGSSGQIILLFDADPDGERCTKDSLARLSRSVFVKAPDMGSLARKPHQLTPEQIQSLLGS